MIGLRYVAPDPIFTDYVSAYYLFSSDAPEMEAIERADIAQLRFTLEGVGRLRFSDGRIIPCPPICLIGPRNRASRICAVGPVRIFGIGLLPAGWLALTQMPAHILADKAANGLDILAGPLTATHEEMMRATRLAEMADAANTYLRAVVAAADPPPAWLIRAVEQWLHGSSDPDLADLLRRTGLSNTQAQRQLKHLFGAPPKLLARKYRALRAATRIASGERDWTDYIGDGFYDQSHCIREIKQFTGVTPAAIRRAPALTPMEMALTETGRALEF